MKFKQMTVFSVLLFSLFSFHSMAGTEVFPGNEAIELPNQPTLADYVAYAVAKSPSLKVAYNEWMAQTETVEQAGYLPDPMIEYKYFIEEVETRVGPQKQSIGVSQAFPWFGELEIKSNIASKISQAYAQKYEAFRFELEHQVSSAYFEYFYIQKALEITEANTKLLKYIENVALNLYRVGSKSRANLIQSQVETLKLDDMLSELQEKNDLVKAKFNTLLDRDIQQDIFIEKSPAFYNIDISEDQIIAIAQSSNPQIASLASNISGKREGIELAKRSYYPDFKLGLSYIDTGDSIYSDPSDNGKDPVIASISLTIPLWQDKYASGVREAKKRYYAAVNMHNDSVNRLEYDIKEALFDYRNSTRKIELYGQSLLPQAFQSVKVLEQGFRAGERDFTEFANSQRLMLEFLLSYYRSVADKAIAVSKIKMLTGGKLPMSEYELPQITGIDEFESSFNSAEKGTEDEK
ncbi:MAG: TolC family protein [Sedimentisphaeraceae bacterium JB056]